MKSPVAPATAQQAAAGRRKGTAIRAWLVVSESGRSCFEEVNKQTIMKRTGLPARDLRVLDPLLSYPSTILGRERAIVINLEHIKAIITATEVLVPNSKDPTVSPFVHDLQLMASGCNGGPQQVTKPSDMFGDAMYRGGSCWPSSRGHNLAARQRSGIRKHRDASTNTSGGGMPEEKPAPELRACKDGGTKVLPFEFKALEICLESACRCLENETLTLEKEAYPALDELTAKLSTLNLERVRQLKSRLVAISGRVQKVRDELEHLLDDDMDMAEMYLSEKLARQPVGETKDDEVDQGDECIERDEEIKSETESSHGSLPGFKPKIEELEMLLEAYFVQIDGTLNKLDTLREYVDDTEDYINIMLDDKQNQLLQMGVMLSTANVVLTAGIVVVSLFGMNIHISIFGDDSNPNQPSYKFWQTTFGTIGGCIGMYLLAMVWAKKSGILQ